ncbi:MAG: hypothetical protein QM647_13930 [Asticcacaulis sp.]|uniref:hypothetical protein n=1 Tax=Asticcacaulis sp. TaxID=1872648 RepID=UPI0039E42EDE
MSAPLLARHQCEFLDLILVECPACHGRAEVRRSSEPGKRRLTCTACFHARNILPRDKGITTYPPTANICNGHPLWLEAETRLGKFYAFNFEHLDHIAAYVAAPLRRVDFGPVTFRNSSVSSRLPLWVKVAKNRGEVLKIIDRLRRK